MDLELPFWVEPDDVRVDIDSHKVEVNVRSSYNIKRTFWRDM